MKRYHLPVMLEEAIEGLAIKPDGCYVDATFGGGGHSRAILQQLNNKGQLIVFDQDEAAQRNLPEDKRLTFVPENFRFLRRFLRVYQVEKIDGLLADLGVSSFQFDTPERGFSTRFEGELDMRMDKRQPLTAAEIIKTYSEKRLHKLFEQYGEVTNARTLAKLISQARDSQELSSTESLKALLQPIVKGNPNRYFAQVFQALRIEVNDELGALKALLEQSKEALSPGGRLVVISFHSIEDRLVKNFIRSGETEVVEEDPFQLKQQAKQYKIITKKPVVASRQELKQNPRAGSARLRIAEKL